MPKKNLSKETESFTEKSTDFETKLDNAKNILQILMNPEITLQDSVKAYEKGMGELAKAQKMLEEAKIKINEIKTT
ncbi:MAG: exodeoxyribonuclease VII small subunit [Sulfurimonas sp.]|nr:MAG: exodeoxyribonuclease VII small subunit [Sulfurimonas sp.]